MKNLPRIVERVTNQPWLITADGYSAIYTVLQAKLAGTNLGSDYREDNESGFSAITDKAGIAQVMLSGIMGQRLGMIEKCSGGVSYEDIPREINESLESGVRGILLQFDSPGGQAVGAQEAAEYIAELEVPTVAFTDSIMCSAAYFLASGCDAIYATSSSRVGSLGAIMPWVDRSRMYDMTGQRDEPIVSTGDDLKSAGGGPSLTLAQREHLQKAVDDLAATFKNHVSQFRTLDYGKLRGGSFSGSESLALNLVDKVGNYADAYSKLQKLMAKS